MTKNYEETLDKAYSKMLASVKKDRFSTQHQKVFDTVIPSYFKQNILPELLDSNNSSPAVAFNILKQHKWELTDKTGYFGLDKEEARVEMGRIFDNFIGDVIEGMEVNMQSSKTGRNWMDTSVRKPNAPSSHSK